MDVSLDVDVDTLSICFGDKLRQKKKPGQGMFLMHLWLEKTLWILRELARAERKKTGDEPDPNFTPLRLSALYIEYNRLVNRHIKGW